MALTSFLEASIREELNRIEEDFLHDASKALFSPLTVESWTAEGSADKLRADFEDFEPR